jgi:hypothetical protein
MQIDSVGEVIAVRELFLANDPRRKVVVKMGKPQPLPDALGNDHYCPIQITGLGSERVKQAAGIDAFQAIALGLKLIGIDLQALNKKHSGELRWEGDEQGDLGFPNPDAIQE